jgi:hypothetical protein
MPRENVAPKRELNWIPRKRIGADENTMHEDGRESGGRDSQQRTEK